MRHHNKRPHSASAARSTGPSRGAGPAGRLGKWRPAVPSAPLASRAAGTLSGLALHAVMCRGAGCGGGSASGGAAGAAMAWALHHVSQTTERTSGARARPGTLALGCSAAATSTAATAPPPSPAGPGMPPPCRPCGRGGRSTPLHGWGSQGRSSKSGRLGISPVRVQQCTSKVFAAKLLSVAAACWWAGCPRSEGGVASARVPCRQRNPCQAAAPLPHARTRTHLAAAACRPAPGAGRPRNPAGQSPAGSGAAPRRRGPPARGRPAGGAGMSVQPRGASGYCGKLVSHAHSPPAGAAV